MAGVEVDVSVEISSGCEIKSFVNQLTGAVELTFTDSSVFVLGFSGRSFEQFMEHWPHLLARYEVAKLNKMPAPR